MKLLPLGVAALLAMSLICVSKPAHARWGDYPERPERARAAKPDTTRLLPRWLGSSIELGPGWMQSPKVIRSRYGPSLSGGLALRVQPRHSLELAARLSYMNLAPHEASFYGFYDSSGVAPGVVLTGGGNGHLVNALAVVSVRALGSWWLEGGAGGGHFGSGYPNEEFVDIVSGKTVNVPGKSGWGGAFSVGSRIEFQPAVKERFFAGADWTRFNRGGTSLDFIQLRLGYRLP